MEFINTSMLDSYSCKELFKRQFSNKRRSNKSCGTVWGWYFRMRKWLSRSTLKFQQRSDLADEETELKEKPQWGWPPCIN